MTPWRPGMFIASLHSSAISLRRKRPRRGPLRRPALRSSGAPRRRQEASVSTPAPTSPRLAARAKRVRFRSRTTCDGATTLSLPRARVALAMPRSRREGAQWLMARVAPLFNPVANACRPDRVLPSPTWSVTEGRRVGGLFFAGAAPCGGRRCAKRRRAFPGPAQRQSLGRRPS